MVSHFQNRLKIFLCSLAATLVLFGMILSTNAHGTTWYLSPTGSDANAGNSSSSPWQTFPFAIQSLFPGDTLILANGTYNGSNSGYPDVRCGTNARTGTAAQPITVKAANERQAFLNGTGHQNVLFVQNCLYWNFHGLRMTSADATSQYSDGTIVQTIDSAYLTFRRLLLSNNNRYKNSSLLLLNRTHNSLVEESEFYSFHRHGVLTTGGNGNIFRRNYANSRNRVDISGGYVSDPINTGDGGITIYPGNNNIVENNIVENTGTALGIEADYGTAINNHFLGNITLNTNFGLVLHARGNTLNQMPRDTYLENHISMNSLYHGVYFRGAKNTQCVNCMAHHNQSAGLAADLGSPSGDGQSTAFFHHSLAVDNGVYGLLFDGLSDLSVTHSNTFGQSYDVWPSTHQGYSNISSLDPGLGSCKVFIPDNSVMKGAGTNGADIGATVLHRYQSGTLTNSPLWAQSGAFTCGAVITGVNDLAGNSCMNVHQRLNVNTNGCTFPSSYSSGGGSGGGGGGSTTSPPMATPAPGSTLTNTTVAFTGGHTSQDAEHWLYVGTSVGGNNLHDSGSMGTGHSRTVSGLPTSGTIHVRWYTKNSSGAWLKQDHTYAMNAGGSGGGGSTTFPPPMATPAPGSTLTSTTVAFTGGHTSQDAEHWLYVGTSVGGNNLHDSGSMGTGHSRTVSGLPTSGTIHVRWYTKNSSGEWFSQFHTFTMNIGN